MSKGSILSGLLAMVLLSCTKDRFPPLTPGGEPGTESTIYFWDFNTHNAPDISVPVVAVGAAQMTYSGEWDYSDGTTMNGMQGTTAGSSLRSASAARRRSMCCMRNGPISRGPAGSRG